MTAARRVLPLSLACLLALALPAAPARAETFTIDGTVNRSNGGNVLDGDDEIIINKGARIEVNRSSTPLIAGEANTGVILRKSDGTNSPNNTVRNNGDIVSTGDFGEGVSVIDGGTSGNRLFNNGNISAVGRRSRGVELGQNSRLVNNGTITLTDDSTTDDPATGVLVGSNSIITNNGAIESQDTDGAVVFGSSGSIGGSTLNNNAGGRIIQRALRNGGTSGPAVAFSGDGNTLNNAGRIDQQGNELAILFSNGNNNTFKNSGTITTSADNGGAAVEFNARSSTGNTIDNLKGGRIITKGNAAPGIQAGNRNTITNAGAITTEGLSAYGILIDANNKVINSGTITTAGNSSFGINASLSGNTVTNSGTITTTGPFASAISSARGNTITNSKGGKIATSGESSHGIIIGAFSSGETTITNSGAISVTGRNAHAITTNRGNNTVTNRGTLSSRGGHGIRLVGADNSVSNEGGAITISGDNVEAISARADNNRISNNGALTTRGANSAGIRAGNNTTLTLGVNSRITTTGANSDGIRIGSLSAASATLRQRGSIKASATGIAIAGDIPTLINEASPGVEGSGLIQGGATGVTAPYIGRLDNSGRIIGRTGDGVRLTATANPRTATVENSGTIQGQTHGLNYGVHAISNLQNSGTIMGTNESGVTFTGTTTNPVTVTNSGKIQGGTYGLDYRANAIVSLQNTTKASAIRGGRNEALRTASLATLDNEGTIASNSAAAITLTGETSQAATVTNSGTIQGQTHGLDYGAHFITRLSNNGGVIRGTNGAGVTFTGTARNPVTVTNSGKIQGGTYGLNYGRNAIAELQNTTKTSAIRGGRNEALSAASLATLNNAGTIASTSAAAIALTGTTTQAATVSNSGTIQGQTHGLNYGAHVITRLNNSGAIIGTTGAGVTLTGNTTQAATITNTGTIRGGTYGLNYGNNPIASLTNTSPRTLRGGSREALSAGSLLRLENSGTILSDKASAITLTRTVTQAATITNTGTIQGNIHGLDYNNNAIASLTNSGTIRATTGIGVKAAGLATLNNIGTIEGNTGIQINRPGTLADGAASPAGATINNAGTLRSLKGSEGTALELIGPGRDTLKLQAGSTLEGQVRWDGQDDTLNLATGPARLTLIDNNAEPGQAPTPFTINTNGRPFLLNTTPSTARGQAQTTVTVLDPARIHTRTESTQSQWTGAVFQSLAQQQGIRTGPNARNSTAAVHQTLWVRPFGGLHNFKRDGLTPAARYRYGGALAGYAVASTDWQAGGFVGAAQDTLAARGPGADAEGRHVFAGAYATTRWQALNLKAGLLFGQSRTETEWQRLNNQVTGGQERVVYEGQRYVVSPELGLATRLTVRGVALEPALSLRYLGLFGAEEDERLVAGREPLRFEAEDRHVGLVRASVGMPLRFPVNAYGGQLYGQLRVGAEGRKRFGGARIEARRGDGVVRFKVADEATVRGFMGAGFEYVVPDLNLSFSADLEASYGSEAVLGVQGQLGVVWGF